MEIFHGDGATDWRSVKDMEYGEYSKLRSHAGIAPLKLANVVVAANAEPAPFEVPLIIGGKNTG